jgi:RNA polymerase sigma-70 factor (ECF subfamily)
MSREKSIPDDELIRAFQEGDRRSFDALVVRYQDRVFNICYRMMGDYEDANDCAQDTFIKMYRSLSGFGFRSSFSTWIYRVAVNTCKNRLSSSAHRRSRAMVRINGSADRDREEGSMDIGDCAHSPNGAFERKEREALIQGAIDSLPREQRTVVVLRDIEGFAYEDIALITGLNLGTVKSKIARARQRLKEKLKGQI